MDMNNATLETSGSRSDSFLPLKKRMRFSDEPDNVLVVATATKKVAVSENQNPKYKGVVQQQNGHWGAQLYTDHKRIWLGTFKSAAEAAMAYDSAVIKLRGFDANSYRNFPWSDITVQEQNFQEGHTTEAVLNMIRDGSYNHKFREFLRVRSQIAASMNIVGSKQVRREGYQDSNNFLSCTQLFQKELTLSDVGKLNRLVIPKKYAVKYLPFISQEQTEREEGEIGGPVEDIDLAFYDEAMRQWKFRYCYWRKSQSFVFTRGWNGFVKKKNLKEKDVIAFYTCQVPDNVNTLEGQIKNFLMIDVHYYSNNASVVPDEVNKMMVHHDTSDEEVTTQNLFSSKLEVAKSEKNKGGFMLFSRLSNASIQAIVQVHEGLCCI